MARRRSKGFSLLELTVVLVIVALVSGGAVYWAYARSGESRSAMQLVELATAVRARAVAAATAASSGLANEGAGTYAWLGADWLQVNLEPRWIRGGAVAVPVTGVGFTVAGVRSPWGASPPATLDVGRIVMTGVPSDICPIVATGLIRGFDRVRIDTNVALDAGQNPVAQTQILTWCASAPTLTIEVLFA